MTSRARAEYRRLKHEMREAVRDVQSSIRLLVRRLPLRSPRRSSDASRILILDEMLPDPRFGAGLPRAAELLRAIVDAGWDVTVYPMNAGPEDYVDVRRRFPSVTFLPSTGARGFRRVVRESVGTFDVVLVSRPTVMERFVPIVEGMRGSADLIHVVYDAEAIFTAREALRSALFGSPMSKHAYDAALDAEIALTRNAQAIISVSQIEARLFRSRVSAPVHVVSHATSVRNDPATFEDRVDFLFVGRSAGPREEIPNVDSLIWFVEEIMPRLDEHLGTDYRLLVTGRTDDSLVARLATSRVVFAGVVDDLAPWYDRSRVFIAPTRYAAGLPLKVVEAAAAGIPCVVTDLLADQLQFGSGVECMAAGNATAFAEGCAALYADEDRWRRIRDAASARIAREYSIATFRETVRRVLDESISSRVSSSGRGGLPTEHRTSVESGPDVASAKHDFEMPRRAQASMSFTARCPSSFP